MSGGGSSTDAFVAQAAAMYAYGYFGVLLTLSLLEWILPGRAAGSAPGLRWASNAALAILDSVVLRVLLPLSSVVWAIACAGRGWGLLQGVHLPIWALCLVSLAVLDFTAYFQHYLLHRVPLLWHIHVTHHTDHVVDVTTGFRFHPLESVFTTMARYLAIAVVGLPPAGVLGAELVSTVWGFVDHANVKMPARLERGLRLALVTPEVHRTHHSRDAQDSRTNFGAVTTIWDRLFGTFREEPVAGRDRLVAGVSGFESRVHQTLPWMLAQPFLAADHGASPAGGRLAQPTDGGATRPPASAN